MRTIRPRTAEIKAMKWATDRMLEYIKEHKFQERNERVIQQSQCKTEWLRNTEYTNWNVVWVRDGSSKQ
jgi:hypothetical protein